MNRHQFLPALCQGPLIGMGLRALIEHSGWGFVHLGVAALNLTLIYIFTPEMDS